MRRWRHRGRSSSSDHGAVLDDGGSGANGHAVAALAPGRLAVAANAMHVDISSDPARLEAMLEDGREYGDEGGGEGADGGGEWQDVKPRRQQRSRLTAHVADAAAAARRRRCRA